MERLKRRGGATEGAAGTTMAPSADAVQTTTTVAAAPVAAPAAPTGRAARKAAAEASVPAVVAPSTPTVFNAPGLPGGYTQEAMDDLGSGESTPWLGFHDPKARKAADVMRHLNGVQDGTPFIWDGAKPHDARGLDLMVLTFWPYWASFDTSFKMSAASVVPQPIGGPLKKNVLAICLHLPGGRPLPAELAPAFATLSTFRSTKAPIVEGHVEAVRQTTEPGWAAKAGELERAVLGWPAEYRIASGIVLKTMPGGGGHPYQLGSADPHVITVDQGRAIQEFLADEDMREELAAVTRQFEARKKVIEAFAKRTPAT